MASTVVTNPSISKGTTTFSGFGWVCDPTCNYGKPKDSTAGLGSSQDAYYVHGRRPMPSDLLRSMTPLPPISRTDIQAGIKLNTTWFTSAKAQPPKIQAIANVSVPYWSSTPSIVMPAYGNQIRNDIANAVALSIGESMAEAAKTVDAVALGAKGLHDLYTCLRKGNCDALSRSLARGRKTACRFADVAIGVDLAMKLGLKPTADLVGNAYNEWKAQDAMKGNDRLKRGTVYHSGTGSLRNPSYYLYEKRKAVSRKVVYYYLLTVDGRVPVTVDPFETGWDLIPMSFMIGWFMDVASHVNSRIMPTGWSWVGGTETLRTLSMTTFAVENSTGVTADVEQIQPYISQVSSYERRTLSTVPLPDSIRWTTAVDIVKGVPTQTRASFGKLATALEILYKLRFSKTDLCKERRASKRKRRTAAAHSKYGMERKYS